MSRPGIAFASLLVEALGAALLRAKAPGTGEPWAESDPALPRLEAACTRALLVAWRALREKALGLLGLPSRKALKDVTQPFRFDPAMLLRLFALGEEFTGAMTTIDGPLTRAVWDAWLRGAANAAAELDTAAPAAEAHAAVRVALQHRGFELVRDGVTRELRDKIVAELSTGIYDGMNPTVVSEQLRERFGRSEYNWERLARSEIAMAQADGKAREYAALGVTHVDYLTSQDSRVSAICRSLAAAGPYPLDEAPRPVRDSHPNCRCSLLARLDD